MDAATVCGICDLPETEEDPFERGHIVARVDGGTSDPENYVAVHQSCNRREGGEIRQRRERETSPPIPN